MENRNEAERQSEEYKKHHFIKNNEYLNEVYKQLHLTIDDEYQHEEYKQAYLSMEDGYQNDSECQNEEYKQPHLSMDDECLNEASKNGVITDNGSQVWEVDSSLHGKTVLFSSMADRWRDSSRTFSMFVYILALISLIMAKAALVMTLLRCFPSCAFGWHLFQEKCYHYSFTGKTWGKASQDCRDLGADLVVINNEKEKDFLVYMMNNAQPHWIGLSDVQAEGVWKWVDGIPVSYRNWYPSDPNNQTVSGENYAVLMAVWPNMWHVKACTHSFGYICEKNMQLVCIWQYFCMSS